MAKVDPDDVIAARRGDRRAQVRVVEAMREPTIGYLCKVIRGLPVADAEELAIEYIGKAIGKDVCRPAAIVSWVQTCARRDALKRLPKPRPSRAKPKATPASLNPETRRELDEIKLELEQAKADDTRGDLQRSMRELDKLRRALSDSVGRTTQRGLRLLFDRVRSLDCLQGTRGYFLRPLSAALLRGDLAAAKGIADLQRAQLEIELEMAPEVTPENLAYHLHIRLELRTAQIAEECSAGSRFRALLGTPGLPGTTVRKAWSARIRKNAHKWAQKMRSSPKSRRMREVVAVLRAANDGAIGHRKR
jgi:hypothetical protein